MFTKHNYVVILLAISVGHVTYASFKNSDEDVYEEGTLEAKIIAALQIETKKILESINKKMPEQLEKNYQVIQDGIDNKIHELEKNIFNKLEEYIDEKFSTLEKHVYRKIDALKTIVPDKTDTSIINHKLDALKKLQLDYDGSVNCTLANKTSQKSEQVLNQKLNIIQKTILDLENTTTTFNFYALYKNLASLKDNLNHNWIELKEMIPAMEENIKRKLDGSGNKVPEHFAEYINLKLDTMEKKVFNLNDNILRRLDTLDKKFEQNIDHMEEIQKKIPELKQNMDNKMDALQNFRKDVLAEVYQSRYLLVCKEQHIIGNVFAQPYHRMDDQTLNHVTYTKDVAGFTYFEMRLAIKGNESAYIMLSPEQIYQENIQFQIGFYPDNANFFRMNKQIITKYTPSILSPHQFTAIYVKIFNNGMLEMGKEGQRGSLPLITYNDPALKLVKYFSFASGSVTGEATFLYDCPSTAF